MREGERKENRRGLEGERKGGEKEKKIEKEAEGSEWLSRRKTVRGKGKSEGGGRSE
jgi:hypothetical protein